MLSCIYLTCGIVIVMWSASSVHSNHLTCLLCVNSNTSHIVCLDLHIRPIISVYMCVRFGFLLYICSLSVCKLRAKLTLFKFPAYVYCRRLFLPFCIMRILTFDTLSRLHFTDNTSVLLFWTF